jgi:hypothetical protein
VHLCLSTFLLSYFLTYMRAHLLSLSYRGHLCTFVCLLSYFLTFLLTCVHTSSLSLIGGTCAGGINCGHFLYHLSHNPNHAPDAIVQRSRRPTLGHRCHTEGVVGAARPQGAPGRSRHAQRAQRALPEPEACPAPRRISVQARPHRLRSKRDATRLPGAAGRCGAVVTRRVFRARRGDAVPSCWGIAARGGPPPKGAHELRRLRVWLELRRHP